MKPIVGATAPARLRIVRSITSKSLVVAVLLPSGYGALQQSLSSNVLAAAAAMPTHDGLFWMKFSKSPVLLKISTILRGLGLRQLNSGPGRVLFQHDTVNQLADAVTDAVQRLPATPAGLVDAATDYSYEPLQEEVAQLLHRFGDDVWGANSDRTWLLTTSEGEAEYTKDLIFEEAEDKVVLIYYLRLWILVKAFNRTRNKALSRTTTHSQTSASSQEKQRTSREVKNLSPPPQHSQLQASAPTQETTKRKGSRRPRSKYLSKEVIQGGSDEFEEEDTRSTDPLPQERGTIDVQTREAATNSIEEHSYDNEHSSFSGSRPIHIGRISKGGSLRTRKSRRQGKGACKSCQERHQRCDRVQPTCERCTELGVVCESSIMRNSTVSVSPLSIVHSTHLNRTDTSAWSESEGDPAAKSTTPLTTGGLHLLRYWNHDNWRQYFQKGNDCEFMLATMRSLGLRVTLREPTQCIFDIDSCVSLCEDVKKVAQELSSKRSASQLFYHAEDRTYLDAEIDILLGTHSLTWGVDADRTKLLAPGSDENYPKNLFYEEAEDQETISTHLHRWIFLTAFWNCKQRSGPGVTEAEDNSQIGDTELPEDTRNDMDDGSVVPLATKPDIAFNKPPRRRQKRKSSSITASEQQAILLPVKQRRKTQHRSTPPGHDLCNLFLSYLENYHDPSFNEIAALENLTQELSLLEGLTTPFPSAQVHRAVTAFVTISFPAWLQYRTEIVTNKHKHAGMQSSTKTPQQHHHIAVMERSRLATHLRQARERFMQAGYGDLRPEQIILQAMEVFMDGHGQSSVVESLRSGFIGMEEELANLGNQLMKYGGTKWVMGDFPSVSTLDGFVSE